MGDRADFLAKLSNMFPKRIMFICFPLFEGCCKHLVNFMAVQECDSENIPYSPQNVYCDISNKIRITCSELQWHQEGLRPCLRLQCKDESFYQACICHVLPKCLS